MMAVQKSKRRGAIAVLTALCLVILLAIVSFAVDIGYILVAKTDLQRAADAAAHAAVLEYRTEQSRLVALSNARHTASKYVEDNKIVNSTATVSKNWFNADPQGDILLGRIDLDNPSQSMTLGNINGYNAVRVRIRRSADKNGELALFFARVLGNSSIALEASSTVAMIHDVSGFKILPSSGNIPFLPITIREQFWNERLDDAVDDWAFDALNKSIEQQSDGIPEVVLFPSSTEAAGNFGTLNVGISANSTKHLSDKIRNGLDQTDLDFHGGTLELDSNGELELTGDPGMSSSIKVDLTAIAGRPVIIPLYREVAGQGDTSKFTIVKFVGVRIMAVQLTGSEKFVTVQPADVSFKGTVQAPSGQSGTSQNIYSPPMLVQ